MVNFENKSRFLGYVYLFVCNYTLACFFATLRDHVLVFLLIKV
jgi:hypothetical protein